MSLPPPKIPPPSNGGSSHTQQTGNARRHSLDWSVLGLPEREAQLKKSFAPSVAITAIVILGLFFGLSVYTEMSDNAIEEVQRYYTYYIDVQIMVFIGFGFLMTFMRRYSYGAVALNYFASALMILEAILCIGATQQVFWNLHRTKIQVDLPLLIDCSFCAASGMIAFGAIIGKSTPTQTLWLLFLQVPLYALNQQLVMHTFKALDMGGTIVIHLFGAYYGLAASMMLSRKQPLHGLDNPKNTGAYLNDIFSMIGTIFLFIYWPSFNGALASVSHAHLEDATYAEKSAQFLSIVNTLFSLLGAVLAVFCTSALVGGKLNMVHIQNSTLAGGVAMGAACTLRMTPGGALAVGLGAGLISTLGFQYLTPFLDRTIGLGDTCGVHNLHGIPAIVGSLVAGLAALGQHSDYLEHDTGRLQLGYQVLAMVVTMGIAITGGLIAGWLVSWVNVVRQEPLLVPELFDDGSWWHGQRVEMLPASTSQHLAKMNSSRHENTTHRNKSVNAGGLNPIHEGPEPAPIAVSGVPAGQHVLTVGVAGGVGSSVHGGASSHGHTNDVPLFANGMAMESALRPVQPMGVDHA